jgi:hypothetical protein
MKSVEKRGKNKKGQFYIISAVVIIILIVSIVAIRNSTSVKKPSEKFYDMSEVLKLEGRQVIENAEFKGTDVQTSTENYLSLFYKYLEEHTNEDFSLIVIYGNINVDNNITGKIYAKASSGSIGINIGSSAPITIAGGNTIRTEDTQVTIDKTNPDKRLVNVTISAGGINITQQLPVLEDNNFLFLMTTNEGFNKYVQSSTNP